MTDGWINLLKKPFKEEEIEWRIQQSGNKNGKVWAKCLAYVTSRAIQDRLDEVFGPSCWQNSFVETSSGFICGIGVFEDLHNGWIWKYDGADKSDIEPFKGGLSGAMKRAAVHWGIGRYLYNLEEGWADVRDDGKYYAKTKEGVAFHWNPPQLPEWALPEGTPRNEKVVEKVVIGEFHANPGLVEELYAIAKEQAAVFEDVLAVARHYMPDKVGGKKIKWSDASKDEYLSVREAFEKGIWKEVIRKEPKQEPVQQDIF